MLLFACRHDKNAGQSPILLRSLILRQLFASRPGRLKIRVASKRLASKSRLQYKQNNDLMNASEVSYANAMGAHGIWAPGVVVMRSLNFKAKALLISLAFLVPMLSLIGWLLINQTEQAMQERKDATREHVEVAHGVIVWAHAREASGELTREQAQTVAKSAVSKLRYNKDEYFWINDMQPVVVMHPIKPELDGKDVGNLKDPNGLALFKAFVDVVARDGQGFVGYQWPKPGREQPVDKLSYVKGFKPWGWVVGSGIYVDDLQEAQRERQTWVGAVVSVLTLKLTMLLASCVVPETLAR